MFIMVSFMGSLEVSGRRNPRPSWPVIPARLAWNKLLRVDTRYKKADLLEQGDIIVVYYPNYREYEVSRIEPYRSSVDVFVFPPKWELDYLRGKDYWKMGMSKYMPVLVRTGPDYNQMRVG